MNEIHLTEQDVRFIEAQVERGVYKDVNDVIYAGLRSLRREISRGLPKEPDFEIEEAILNDIVRAKQDD